MKLYKVIIALLAPCFLVAQNNEGKIIYDKSIKVDIDIPEEHREQLAGLLPDAQTAKKVLIFNSTESIYKDDDGQDTEEVVEAGSESSGMRVKMVMARPDNQLYKNISDQQIIEKEEMMGRYFRIVDDLPTFPWKLSNESKTILGYICQKAMMDHDEHQVVAWYAPQIPISNGPMQFGQLPGMILELDIDHGQAHMLASDIQFMSLDKDAIEKPSSGKKVSRQEFEEIEAKKQQEMEEEYGGNGNRMIIRQRRE